MIEQGVLLRRKQRIWKVRVDAGESLCYDEKQQAPEGAGACYTDCRFNL